MGRLGGGHASGRRYHGNLSLIITTHINHCIIESLLEQGVTVPWLEHLIISGTQIFIPELFCQHGSARFIVVVLTISYAITLDTFQRHHSPQNFIDLCVCHLFISCKPTLSLLPLDILLAFFQGAERIIASIVVILNAARE